MTKEKKEKPLLTEAGLSDLVQIILSSGDKLIYSDDGKSVYNITKQRYISGFVAKVLITIRKEKNA